MYIYFSPGNNQLKSPFSTLCKKKKENKVISSIKMSSLGFLLVPYTWVERGIHLNITRYCYLESNKVSWEIQGTCKF